jgi:hypothetical protein
MQSNNLLPNPFIPALHQHLVQWPARTSGINVDGTKYYTQPDLAASQAEKKLWKLGDDGDRYHRAKILRPLPQSVGNAVATVYKDRYRTDNKKKEKNTAQRRANQFLTGIYNRHLAKKLATLCQNPLIYKTSEMIVEDEYLDMTFGRAPELKGLNQQSRDAHQDYLYCLLEMFDTVGLMPVKKASNDEDARIIYFDDGTINLKLPQSDNHEADSRHLQNFWNRTDNELRDYSFDMVRIVYQFMLRLISAGENEFSEDKLLIRMYYLMCALPNQMGIREKYQNIKFENFTAEHAEIGISRFLCEKWWLRKLRKVHRQKHEEIAIACGVVHNGTQCYVSNSTYRYYQQREIETSKVLSEMVAYNEDTGQEVPLPKLIEKSVANPTIRRHELMTRMRGCEDFAKDHDHAGLFITVTAPSRYHATSTKTLFGKKTVVANPKYDGATPDQTNKYLNHVWALVRNALGKFDIKPYGFRVVEPHEDETPHQHYMLFCDHSQKARIVEVFNYYGLKVDGHEAGAKKHRVTIVHIDPKKGSATGYIAKYISKNIDGFQSDGKEIDGDSYGNKASEAAKRITAWRKCWGIRAFQPFGQPSVTVWRELRKFNGDEKSNKREQLTADIRFAHNAHVITYLKLKRLDKNGTGEVAVWRDKMTLEKKATYNAHVIAYLNRQRPINTCSDNIIEKARMWADTGHWDKYIESMGGVNISRTLRPLWILKDHEPQQNRYNEAVPNKSIGVRSDTGFIVTSGEKWTLHIKGDSPYNSDAAKGLRALQSLSARRADALKLAGTAVTRSAVNNCTDGAPDHPKNSIDQHDTPTNSGNPPTFRPFFDYPAPPQIVENKNIIEKTAIEDQPIAEMLLNHGINEHLIAGTIRRLNTGQTVRLNGTQGYKIYHTPDGGRAIFKCILQDPGEDWFDDPEDESQTTQTMSKTEIQNLFDLTPEKENAA